MEKISYRHYEGLPNPKLLEQITLINQTIFGFNETAQALSSLFEQYQKMVTIVAYKGERAVGFKVGLVDQMGSMESWRGGVIPSERRQGIAQHLMRLQHDWCRQKGIRTIKTTTSSDNSAMLILNLQEGFHIVGCFVNQHRKLKILQERRL